MLGVTMDEELSDKPKRGRPKKVAPVDPDERAQVLRETFSANAPAKIEGLPPPERAEAPALDTRPPRDPAEVRRDASKVLTFLGLLGGAVFRRFIPGMSLDPDRVEGGASIVAAEIAERLPVAWQYRAFWLGMGCGIGCQILRPLLVAQAKPADVVSFQKAGGA